MQKDATLERLELARTHLFLDHTAFGSLSLNLKFSDKNPTPAPMATDGTHCFYTPSKIADWTEAQLIFTIAHEALHCGFLHPWRMGSRDIRLWNIACDHVINAELIKSKVGTPPEGVLYEPAYDGMSAEQVYAKLQADEQKKREEQEQEQDDDNEEQEDSSDSDSQDSQDSENSDDEQEPDDSSEQDSGNAGQESDDGASDSTGTDTKGAQDSSSQANDTSNLNAAGDGDSNVPGTGASDIVTPVSSPLQNDDVGNTGNTGDTPTSLTETDWQTITEQAFLVANKAGVLPGSLDRAIKDTHAPTSDLYAKLRQFLEACNPTDFSWQSPNKKFLVNADMYLPGLHKENMPPIVVAIDTSCSVTQQMLDLFGALLTDVTREMRPRELNVIYCDTSVRGTEKFDPDDDIKLEAKGGGGTYFAPVFNYVAENNADYAEIAALIYITDLQNYDTQATLDAEPAYPVLWVTPSYITTEQPYGERATIDMGRYGY